MTSQPVQVTNGLSNDLPGAGLPSYLNRGPTPPGPSFHMLRQALRIVSARAGANEDKAALSFDDDEDTSWSNDGNRATGWIEYELAQPATIGELELKMGGWRRKSYPIRITVDGKEVFRGKTPQSLGYITIPVNPTRGKTVGIQLIGSTVNRDAFGNIVELKSQENGATTGDQKAVRGSLDIVEVEIYRAAL